MAGALFIIAFISVCALLIAANLFVRRNRRTPEDLWDERPDSDAYLINVLNSVHYERY